MSLMMMSKSLEQLPVYYLYTDDCVQVKLPTRHDLLDPFSQIRSVVLIKSIVIQAVSLFVLPFFVLIEFTESKVTKTLLPAESERHERTFMSWPQPEHWEEDWEDVQWELVMIAHSIVPFEPVTVLVSPDQFEEATRMLGSNIDIMKIPVDDLWARDTIPVFTLIQEIDERGNISKEEVVGVDLNFNGWGNKQRHEADSQVGDKLLQQIKVKRTISKMVAEGGSFETDGAGTLLVTESSVINDNRNQGKSKAEIETILKGELGVKKVIWFKGIKGQDITDAHIDSVVRFVRPGRVIVTRPQPGYTDPDDIWAQVSKEALEVLAEATDAEGRKFEIVELYEPDMGKVGRSGGGDNDFASTYVNFYVINGAVIMPKFGDKEADAEAEIVLGNEFPGRKIVGVEISAVAGGGGGIHCATHELPYRHADGDSAGNEIKLSMVLLTSLLILKLVLAL